MSDTLHLRLILDAIAVVREYTKGGKEPFLVDPMRRDGVVWRLATIGEAVKDLSEEACAKEPHIPWRRIAGMRDRLIHGYASVDFEIVWEVVEDQLDPLEQAVRRLLDES